MKKLNLLTFLIGISIFTYAQQLQKGSVAYYESMRIAYQTKIDWINQNVEEKTLAEQNHWFEMANANVQQMMYFKSLAKQSESGIYLPNQNHSINVEAGGGTCSGAAPFCTGSIYDFPCGTNESPAEGGPNYGCLASQPNPAWYYLQIENGGDLIMSLSAPQDIDFIIWGPFESPICNYDSLSEGNIVDCSYSSTNNETPEIGPSSSGGATTAQAGMFYMCMITNYSNSNQDFTLQQTGGNASTSCCNLETIQPIVLSGWNSDCTGLMTDSGTVSIHNIGGDVSFTNDAAIDSIVFTYDGVPFQSNYPPFTTIPINYGLNNLLSDNQFHNVGVRFYNTNGAYCNEFYYYKPLDTCSDCNVDAGDDVEGCSPLNINAIMDATDLSGTWSCPSNDVSFDDINAPATSVNYTGSSSDTVNCLLIWTINNQYGLVCEDSLNIQFYPSAQTPILTESSEVVCENGEAIYTVSTVENCSYHWGIPPFWTSTDIDTSTITVVNNGESGIITVYTQNACGFSDTLEVAVTVTNQVASQPSIISGPNPVCANSSVIYSVEDVPGVTYYWNLPSGWTGSENNSSINANTGASGGTITLVPFNDCGMGIARTLNVSIQETVGATQYITGEQEVCEGSTQVYSTFAENASGYQWQIPNTWVGNSNFETITVTVGSEAGNITVSPYNSCGNGDSSSIFAFVFPLPIASWDFSIDQSEVTFSNLSQNAYAYSWNFGDGESSTENAPIHDYTNDGNYTVTLTAYNDCGENSYESSITIQTIGVNEILENQFSINPNPAKNKICITLKQIESGQIQIFNSAGQIVLEKHFEDKNKIELNTEALKSGVYLIKLQDSKNSGLKKLIIK